MDRTGRTDRDESTPEGSAAERDRELEQRRAAERDRDRDLDRDAANPPRTTTGKMTSPKFGSATSGGGELEPGPERD